MKKKQLELRMYGLVLYQLSGIQAGIQFDHAKDEYAEKYGKDKEYLEYRKKHKTVVILNGGTSNDGQRSHYGVPKQLGSMEQHLLTLKENKIKYAPFYEPDLNYALTSIAFLVDERVFNKKDYPDFSFTKEDYLKSLISHWEYDKAKEFQYNEFKKAIGKDIAFLKDFLKQFKLA